MKINTQLITGFAIGCMFTMLCTTVQRQNYTVQVEITKPVVAQLDLRDWRMDKLKEAL